MTCTRCSRTDALPTANDQALCDTCFAVAVDVLTRRIDTAPADNVSRVYVSGMRAIGATNDQIL